MKKIIIMLFLVVFLSSCNTSTISNISSNYKKYGVVIENNGDSLTVYDRSFNSGKIILNYNDNKLENGDFIQYGFNNGITYKQNIPYIDNVKYLQKLDKGSYIEATYTSSNERYNLLFYNSSTAYGLIYKDKVIEDNMLYDSLGQKFSWDDLNQGDILGIYYDGYMLYGSELIITNPYYIYIKNK